MLIQRYRPILLIACLIILIQALGSCAGQKQSVIDARTVHVACNLPMSGSLAIYGQAIKDGASMAIDDLRQVGSNNLHFQTDWQDNAGRAKTTVSIFQRQMLDKPDIYWSGVKPQTIAINDQIRKMGLPHFVWLFDPFVNKDCKAGDLPANNLRTWVNFKIEAPVLINCIKERNAKRVAIVYVKLPNTQEEYEGIVVPTLKAMKIPDILLETYEAGAKDYASIAVKVKDFKPDMIILSGFQDDFVGLIRAMRPLGLIHDGNTICSYDLLDATRILGKDELEGLRLVVPMFADHRENAEVKGWSRRFYEKTGFWPLYTHAYAYDAIMIINDASRRLSLPATSPQWIKALRATKIKGVTGPLFFDQDGSLITPVELAVFKDGVPVPATMAQPLPAAAAAAAK